MKITLAGSPGSGKSTQRKSLAERYNLEIKATGDFMRNVAKKYGYTDITKFIVEYLTEHPEVDRENKKIKDIEEITKKLERLEKLLENKQD